MTKFIRVLPLLLVASAAIAQDAEQAPNSVANLNIPANVQLLGKVDLHLRKATAIVNGAVITGTDVDQRLALIVLANGGQVPDAERDRLRLQVLRNLIDERLQIQEAKTHDITVERSEIERSYGQVAQRFKQTPDGLAAYLRNAGSSDRSIKGQIEGELAWSRLLRRQVEPFVNVSGGEVQSVLDRLQATKGSKEYKVSEIYLSATPRPRRPFPTMRARSSTRYAAARHSRPTRANFPKLRRLRSAAIWAGSARRNCPRRWARISRR